MASDDHNGLKHKFLDKIIDSLADGVFTLDPEGIITSWNRSMEKISGYSAEEALGQSCGIIKCSRCFGRSCPADIARCRILEKGSSGAKECELQHRDGHDVPIIKHASVVKDDDGQVVGIVETVTDITELNRARRRAEEASLKLGEVHRLDRIIGKSRTMTEVFSTVRMAAGSDATVLIQGESGTGKELIAGAIHYKSSRSGSPLITVNCTALPENLLESELFGHVKGAYTGAIHGRIGRFEEANGGTIFLDEIGDLSPYIQVKLLRVLQEREIERLGESIRRRVDIRIVAATHRNLLAMVGEGTFREDLFYRLNVFPVHVPPLRERKEDLPLLVSHFIAEMNRKTGKNIVDASGEVMRIFMDYHWPGNVRELENAIEHAFVVCRHDRIEKEDLPAHLRFLLTDTRTPQHGARPHTDRLSPVPARGRSINREQLIDLLAECGWNKAEAARRLGVSRTAVWKYMKKWEIPLQPG